MDTDIRLTQTQYDHIKAALQDIGVSVQVIDYNHHGYRIRVQNEALRALSRKLEMQEPCMDGLR